MPRLEIEAVLAREVSISAKRCKVVADGMTYVVESDDIIETLWERILDTSTGLGAAFSRLWPASCEWVVEWEDIPEGEKCTRNI